MFVTFFNTLKHDRTFSPFDVAPWVRHEYSFRPTVVHSCGREGTAGAT